jgi:hypothetical protein
MVEVVHAGAPKMTLGQWESGGFDQRRLDAEAGAESQHGSSVLWNVRLEKGQAQGGIYRHAGRIAACAPNANG